MLDSFDRKIYYLRISLTKRCNLKCFYCSGTECVNSPTAAAEISADFIEEAVTEAAALGFSKVRLTGGEPLVRKDIVEIVSRISSVQGISHIGMTTNGILFSEYSSALKSAGLDSVNISMDTLDPQRFKEITGGNIDKVHEAVDAAVSLGLPVKINMVIFETTTDCDIEVMQNYCNEKNITLQTIRHFDLSKKKSDNHNFDRPPRCSNCNRIRLLSDGSVQPCLHSDYSIDSSKIGIREAFIQAIAGKPAEGESASLHLIGKIGG